MDLDEVLPHVGQFGRYQKLVIWLILFPAVFPCGFHAYNQLFMAKVPNHWCKLPTIPGFDEDFVKNVSIPVWITPDNKSKLSECLMYDFDYGHFSNSGQRYNVVQCRQGWSYDVQDIGHSIISEWDLVCNYDYAPTLALAVFGLSGLIGNYIFGYIQDGLGRKPAYYVYLLIQSVFGVATAFSPNFTTWILLRIGVGFTVPAILGTPYVLAIELVGPKDRTMVTILINIAYSLSLVGLSVVVWLVSNWRLMALATTVPFMGLFFTWFLLPESPRWLVAQGRYQEARRILETIARVNGKNLPKDIFPKLQRPLSATNRNHPNYGIKHLFQKPNLRWKTIIITFLWFANTSVYVGLSYYAPALGGDEFLNFFLAGAVELPTYLFLWPAMERLGRRWTLCLSMVTGGTSCLATFLVQENYVIMLTLYCVGKMGISSSFAVLPLMASELYPTVVRGLGMSLSSVIGMLGPIFIPLVNYLGADMLVLPLIIMGALLVIGGMFSLLLPETLNEHLPQTLEDAENTKLDFFVCCVPPTRDV